MKLEYSERLQRLEPNGHVRAVRVGRDLARIVPGLERDEIVKVQRRVKGFGEVVHLAIGGSGYRAVLEGFKGSGRARTGAQLGEAQLVRCRA